MKPKSIVKNSVFNVLYKGLTALFPFIVTVYVSRVLLPGGVGKVSYANTVVLYFVTLAALGIPNYGVKIIAQSKTSREQSKDFFELFCINFISTIICTVAYYAMISFVPHFQNEPMLYRVMGLLLILNVFNIDWFYQGLEEYAYIATRSLLVKVLSIVAIILTVKEEQDYVTYALILCLASAGNYLLNVLHAKKYIVFGDYKLEFRKHMKPVLVLLASAVATEVYTMLDTLMLEHFHGEVSVGLYSNSVKVVRLVYMVVISVVATFYPRISSYVKAGEKTKLNELMSQGVKIILLLACPCFIGLMVVSDVFVPVFFGEAFVLATNTLRILSVLIVVFSVAYFLGHIVLISAGKESSILMITLIGALANGLMNSFLIPAFAQEGAAVASVLSEILVTVLLVMKSKKYFHVSLGLKFVASVALSCLVMLCVELALHGYADKTPLGLALLIAVGVVAFFGMTFLTKNELIDMMMKRIRKKR